VAESFARKIPIAAAALRARGGKRGQYQTVFLTSTSAQRI